jgi:aarF domain-containing kinase
MTTWQWVLLTIGGLFALKVLALLSFRTGRRLLATWLIGFKYLFYGLADLFQLRRLAALLSGRQYQPLTRPRILRLGFEDLGPSYIKLGQIIASSPGLFTDPYVKEFRHCLDRVRAITFEECQTVVKEELGEKISLLKIDPKPLASASIAQVHAATFSDGREIVLKIQRPDIAERVEADVRIMRFWAKIASRLNPTLRLANPVGIVEDFGRTIKEELDFSMEGKNLDDFNQIMVTLKHHPDVSAPVVNWELTTPRVLTMERFHGHTVDDTAAVKASSVNPEEKLLLGMRAWFQCMMFHGFFHGDVHAGNLMWLNDGRIGFIDFGIVGRFSAIQRRLVTRYVMAFATGQFRELTDVLIEMGGVGGDVDGEALAADMKQVYSPLLSMNFGEMNYGDFLPQILGMARKHQLRLPNEFILIIKQLLYFDRYAKLLAPTLNVFTDPRVFSALAEDVQKSLALTSEQAN